MDGNNDAYRQRLKSIISKKIKTAMIFPISQFEIEFGYIWGHGLPDSELTEEQRQAREVWQECRKRIFDNGHKQIRNACTELNMHEVVWKRYRTYFKPRMLGEANHE